MRVVANTAGEVVSTHLPPVEYSSLLRISERGRVVATEKLKTPTDAFGIPNAFLYIAQLGATLDPAYEPPAKTNVHHLIHPKALYHRNGPQSIQYKFRESPSLMVRMPEQMHNYGHWVVENAKMVAMDKMTQYVKEQEQINRLFKIGRAVISNPRWLEGMFGDGQQSYRTAEEYFAKQPNEAMFFDTLDQMEDGQVGLMPDRDDLADLGLHGATRYLGVLAGARSLTLQRESREVVKKMPLLYNSRKSD